MVNKQIDKNKGIFFSKGMKQPEDDQTHENKKILVGDIGGTKTLLALFVVNGKKFKLEKREKYISLDYAKFEDIVQKFIAGSGDIDRGCFGIAGPINKGVCNVTNLPWVVDAKKLEKQFYLSKVFLINDLRANAFGVKTLMAKDLYTLNRGEVDPQGNQALISVGTGLGEAVMFFDGSDHVPRPSEGGHADFAPRDGLEIELLKYLKEKFGHVSYERVLSGQGLVNLYYFLVEEGGEERLHKVDEMMQKENPAKVISRLGLSGECKACQRALRWFCSLYGAEAGNLALRTVATGGIYIGGGIAPKIIKEIKRSDFMKSFFSKGRFSDFLENIPVHVVLEENTALRGAVYYCLNN